MGISRIYMTRALCFPLSSLLWLRLDRLPVFSSRFKRAILVPLSIPHLPSMQQATHPRLHLRDTRDAHIIFEAVRQGFLKPVTRRLNEAERSMSVRSGAVFVWEERDDESGLKRWTGKSTLISSPEVLLTYLPFDRRTSLGTVPYA